MPQITQMFIGIIAVMSIVGVIQLQRIYGILQDILLSNIVEGIKVEQRK